MDDVAAPVRGRGRPPRGDRKCVRVDVYMEPDLVAHIDQVRGEMSRSAYLVRAVQMARPEREG